ncbi:MAG: hypothetical protein PHU46_00205 [Rhodocyclaceae bacterium]|nr:hypothetical protein [Rhodocyclaceae bacterium]
MKIILAIVLTVVVGVAGAAFWLFSGPKWNGYQWNQYTTKTNCIAAPAPGQKDNRLALAGEGDTAAYKHAVSIWSCADGHTMALYEGLPDSAPRKLVDQDVLRYRHGLLGKDDSRRFVTPQEIAGLKTIRDWNTLVATDPR